MAHKANDGSMFTNRPSMVAHNNRMAARKTAHDPVRSSNPHKSASSESDHSVKTSRTMQCPSCGADIDMDAIHEGRDTSPFESGNAPSGSMQEF